MCRLLCGFEQGSHLLSIVSAGKDLSARLIGASRAKRSSIHGVIAEAVDKASNQRLSFLSITCKSKRPAVR